MSAELFCEEFRLPLSAVVLARNEEVNIRRCIESLRWAADVVVVDDGSTDRTREFALSCGARVVSHGFESFARQRNWAMEHADVQHEWVLHLDADEAATEPLHQEIRAVLQTADSDTVAFRMCRKTMLNGKWLKYSDGFPVWIMRLVRNGQAMFEDNGHGEVAVPEVDGKTGTIQEPFLHFPFTRGLSHWIDRHNVYSTREAQLEAKDDQEFCWRQLFSPNRSARRSAVRCLSRCMPCRGWLRFFYQFILKLGFLDGLPGLQFCQMMAMYENWIVLKHREMKRNATMTSVDVPTDSGRTLTLPSAASDAELNTTRPSAVAPNAEA